MKTVAIGPVIWVAVMGWSGAGFAQTVPASAPAGAPATTRAADEKVRNMVDRLVLQMHLEVDPILAHPGVSDVDKSKLASLVQALDDGMAKAAKGDAAEVQKQYAPLEEALRKWMDSKPEFRVISVVGREGANQELQLLQSEFKNKAAAYAGLLKSAGVGEDKVAQAVKLLDDARPRAEALLAAGDNGSMEEFNGLALGLRLAIRGVLTKGQNVDLDWMFQKKFLASVAVPQGVGLPLAYPAFPNAVPAPQDGEYSLKPSPQEAAIKTVKLKKGQLLGFRKTEKGMVAYAGGEEVEVPADKPSIWWQAD